MNNLNIQKAICDHDFDHYADGYRCVKCEAEFPIPTDRAMIAAADRIHGRGGEIEIDGFDNPLPTARVSRGDDDGAYVLAWVWVNDSELTDAELAIRDEPAQNVPQGDI